MARREEAAYLAASMDVGVLADRALLALEVHQPSDLSPEERQLMGENAEVLRLLFLSRPDELVKAAQSSYLISTQSEWYESVATTAKREQKTTAGGDPVAEWVRSAVDVAVRIAEGTEVRSKETVRLASVLEAVSNATYEYTEEVQATSRIEGAEWKPKSLA